VKIEPRAAATHSTYRAPSIKVRDTPSMAASYGSEGPIRRTREGE
jgi:hypothetical protein